MINLITKEELNKLESYRNRYAIWESADPVCDSNPIEDILIEWQEAKKDLFTLFGNKLILSKPLTFTKVIEDVKEDMAYMVNTANPKTYSSHYAVSFVKAFEDWVHNVIPSEDRWKAHSLIYSSTLAEGHYSFLDPLNIPMPNGTTFTIKKDNMKIMKILGKIADAYQLDGYEEFRICHSIILNDKTLNGTLNLTIHPLDFVLMSEETDSGWSSCMSWENYREFRQGSVEMMNSPCVVLATLTNERGEKHWRQNFIINKDLIVAVKGYPWQNDYLTNASLYWLKELAEKNWGCRFTTSEPLPYKNNHFGNELEAWFFCNEMYNDIGTYTKGFISTTVDKSKPYNLNFSGKSQCMWCGLINAEILSPSFLCCSDCDTTKVCADCQAPIDSWSGGYDTEHGLICEDCFNEKYFFCQKCETAEEFDSRNKVNIIFAYDPKSGEAETATTPLYLCLDCQKDYTIYEDLYYNRYVFYYELPDYLVPSTKYTNWEKIVELQEA